MHCETAALHWMVKDIMHGLTNKSAAFVCTCVYNYMFSKCMHVCTVYVCSHIIMYIMYVFMYVCIDNICALLD